MKIPRLLTVTEAAQASGRHRDTILSALRLGELVGHQRVVGGTWRMTEENLVAWLTGNSPLS